MLSFFFLNNFLFFINIALVFVLFFLRILVFVLLLKLHCIIYKIYIVVGRSAHTVSRALLERGLIPTRRSSNSPKAKGAPPILCLQPFSILQKFPSLSFSLCPVLPTPAPPSTDTRRIVRITRTQYTLTAHLLNELLSYFPLAE